MSGSIPRCCSARVGPVVCGCAGFWAWVAIIAMDANTLAKKICSITLIVMLLPFYSASVSESIYWPISWLNALARVLYRPASLSRTGSISLISDCYLKLLEFSVRHFERPGSNSFVFEANDVIAVNHAAAQALSGLVE